MTRKGKGNDDYNEEKRTHWEIRRKLPKPPKTAEQLRIRRHYDNNKEKISARNKLRYTKNKEHFKQRSTERRVETYYKVFKLKYKKSCKMCGYSDFRALDFHHVDPSTKIDTIAQLCNRSVAWHRIETELKKCEIICSNCHRIEHYGDVRVNDFRKRYELEHGPSESTQDRVSKEE